jgi:hypothetical protein
MSETNDVMFVSVLSNDIVDSSDCIASRESTSEQ